MANILQVTNSPLNDTKNITDSPLQNNVLVDRQIKNPSDPSRVMRADGQESGETGSATGERNLGVLGYDSNYGAFLQRLSQETSLASLMRDLFSGRLIPRGEEQAGDLFQALLSSAHFGSPEELSAFLKEQAAEQTKFSGAFFEKVRTMLLSGSSAALKDAALEFLRAYNDFSAGEHLLSQMETLTKDILGLLYPSVRKDFQAIVQEMDWTAENGQTEANVQVLYGKLIPFLSRYVAKTHDYGAVRNAAMLLIFHGIKYENGGRDILQRLFDRMASNREFSRFFLEDPQQVLQTLLQGQGRTRCEGGFSDAFSEMLLRGMNGEAGLEQTQPFYQLLRGMLTNESVYLPLTHLLVPFWYQDKEVTSEIWIDPDAEKEAEEAYGGRKIKFLVRFEIQEIGSFEMAAALLDRRVKLQLAVPPSLMGEKQDIQQKITEIFRKNGMEVGRLLVKEKDPRTDTRLEEIFPEILRKEKMINVRV